MIYQDTRVINDIVHVFVSVLSWYTCYQWNSACRFENSLSLYVMSIQPFMDKKTLRL